MALLKWSSLPHYMRVSIVLLQNDIVKTIKLFEDSTKMVNMISIFSRNEHIDEVSATNLRLVVTSCINFFG